MATLRMALAAIKSAFDAEAVAAIRESLNGTVETSKSTALSMAIVSVVADSGLRRSEAAELSSPDPPWLICNAWPSLPGRRLKVPFSACVTDRLPVASHRPPDFGPHGQPLHARTGSRGSPAIPLNRSPLTCRQTTGIHRIAGKHKNEKTNYGTGFSH